MEMWGNILGGKNAVSFNCAKPAWEMSLWITATVNHMGILTERHKFRHIHTNTYTLYIWITSKRREGASKLVYMQISLRWGDEKQQIHGKPLCYFYLQTNTIEVHKTCLLPTATNAFFVGCSLHIHGLPLHRFAGSTTNTWKGTHLSSLIYILLFCIACCVSGSGCMIALYRWNMRLIF